MANGVVVGHLSGAQIDIDRLEEMTRIRSVHTTGSAALAERNDA